jgi:hypothetical protein
MLLRIAEGVYRCLRALECARGLRLWSKTEMSFYRYCTGPAHSQRFRYTLLLAADDKLKLSSA